MKTYSLQPVPTSLYVQEGKLVAALGNDTADTVDVAIDFSASPNGVKFPTVGKFSARIGIGSNEEKVKITARKPGNVFTIDRAAVQVAHAAGAVVRVDNVQMAAYDNGKVAQALKLITGEPANYKIYDGVAGKLKVTGGTNQITVAAGIAHLADWAFFEAENDKVAVSSAGITGNKTKKGIVYVDAEGRLVVTLGAAGEPGALPDWPAGSSYLKLATLSINAAGVVTILTDERDVTVAAEDSPAMTAFKANVSEPTAYRVIKTPAGALLPAAGAAKVTVAAGTAYLDDYKWAVFPQETEVAIDITQVGEVEDDQEQQVAVWIGANGQLGTTYGEVAATGASVAPDYPASTVALAILTIDKDGAITVTDGRL